MSEFEEDDYVLSLSTQGGQPLESYIGAHTGHHETTDVLPEWTDFEVFEFDSQVFHSF